MDRQISTLKDVENEVDKLTAPFSQFKKGPVDDLTKTYLKTLYMYAIESGKDVSYSSVADMVGVLNKKQIEKLAEDNRNSKAAEFYDDFIHHNEDYQMAAVISAFTVMKNAIWNHTFRRLPA